MSHNDDDVRNHVGWSLNEDRQRQKWIEFVRETREAAQPLTDSAAVLFHGTSSYALGSIRKYGLMPDDLFHRDENGQCVVSGSCWGSFDAAVYYAEDTVVHRHPGHLPVILAIRPDDLGRGFPFVADESSIDFPVTGLHLLTDPAVAEKWEAGGPTPDWRESLRDLGAVSIHHDDVIPMELITVIDEIESLKKFAEYGTRP